MQIQKKALPTALIVFYLLIGLEVIIMITPFTLYFYSIYAPVLEALYSFAPTSWLVGFFLPHIVATNNVLLNLLAYLGPVLLALGLLLFFVGAFQVYSAKLLRKGVVTGGLYRLVRHPQYVGLAIAGLGLLFYWPRFFILVTFISMLFVYYALARNEEQRMAQKYGTGYTSYKERTSLFLPAGLGSKLRPRFAPTATVRGVRMFAVYLLSLALGIGAGFGLREYTKTQVPTYVSENDRVVAVAMAPADKDRVAEIVQLALSDPYVANELDQVRADGQFPVVAYISPTDYMMQHLIADLGEHEKHHAKNESSRFLQTLDHLGKMFILTPNRQLREAAKTGVRRIIFARALDRKGGAASLEDALAINVRRIPFFFTDVNLERSEVIMSMDTARRHSWGTFPLPAF
jgi:protein-S-isoprenylcysteine O-methyltransferase Ste14